MLMDLNQPAFQRHIVPSGRIGLARRWMGAWALAALTLAGLARPAWSQIDPTDLLTKKVVGVGIYYRSGSLGFSGTNGSVTNEVKGYADALPNSMTVTGYVIGVSYGHWGLTVGQDDDAVTVNRNADVNQTPGNAADDVFVKTMRRENSSISLLFQPYRFLFLGLGRDSGTVTFDQVSAAGAAGTRRFNVTSDYYSLGLGLGFNPFNDKLAPVLVAFFKQPLQNTPFAGTYSGFGLGVYF